MSPLGNIFRTFLVENSRRILLSVVSIVAFVAIWFLIALLLREIGSHLADFVPYPQDVGRAFLDSFRRPVPILEVGMQSLMWNSLQRVVIGFLIAFAVAVPLGLLMGAFTTIDYVGRPIVEMIRPIPPIAWVPVFIIALRGFWGPVAIVFIGAFFPILLNVIFGVRSVDPVLFDAARTLGAKRSHLFTKIIAPSVVPFMMTGVKVGLGVAWMCIVAAELLPIRGSGLGNFIWVESDFGYFDYAFAGMIVIGILSILTTGVAELAERRLYRWMGMK